MNKRALSHFWVTTLLALSSCGESASVECGAFAATYVSCFGDCLFGGDGELFQGTRLSFREDGRFTFLPGGDIEYVGGYERCGETVSFIEPPAGLPTFPERLSVALDDESIEFDGMTLWKTVVCPSGMTQRLQCASCGPADECLEQQSVCASTCEDETACERDLICLEDTCVRVCG